MKALSEITRLIKKNKTFLIVSHLNPDGDSAGSCIALALGLKKIGKTAFILNKDHLPKTLKFLPFSNLFNRLPKGRLREFDVLFLLDCNSADRTGIKIPKAKNIVVIDHHIQHKKMQDAGCRMQDKRCDRNTEPKPDIEWIETNASATGELVYKLLEALHIPLDKGTASNLYTAIFTDTGGFRYSNTTPESLLIASNLIVAGADPWQAAREIYEKMSFNRMKLLTLCLRTLKKQDGVAWVAVTHDMFEKTGTSVQDTEYFANYPRKIEGVEVSVFFRQNREEQFKVSMRSNGKVNVADICALFGGGGHSNAAGCTVHGTLKEVQKKLLKAVKEAIKQK
ncbi:MAG: bifunctional oligoribonuclease/PAP phosphatase NrnA [Nitrospirae bacterium]|nr:bifunctional oligoribonuclease/PAP phosphatase NrnA [Nitrospirota bacterium]MBI4838564.1 bifunctional oligoribonuclease/PAP phosphatase NrnA [Nitrospirota bacterium]